MSNAFNIFQDWSANRGNPKGRIVMVLFRTAHLLRLNLVTFVLFLPYFILYRLLVEWFLCIELPWKTRIGAGFRIDHGQALIVNDNAVFGAGCTVRNSTTIGNRKLKDGTYSASPRFGDRVDIGANAVIIGPLVIGDDAAIGAGAVVVKDVPAGHVAVGNPARIIPRRS
ncbi:MAG: DapH/DapD/GlmU-related protein [Flavobacteriales bacterium]|nr:serine acetyltransferase [Flavobacteriales bacterium]MCB9199640.1 serine acetyltransferase [Flavobacteriales bacterium]